MSVNTPENKQTVQFVKKHLGKIYQKIDTVRKYDPHEVNELMTNYEVKVASGADLIKAKQLHASVYLDRKYIPEEFVKNGVIDLEHDPYQQHATYFIVVTKPVPGVYEGGEVVAVVRQIETTDIGIESLPTVAHTNVSKKHFSTHNSKHYVEISAFAKKLGANSNVILLLFKEMLKHSQRSGHKIWIMAVDEHVYWRMKTLFPFTIRKIGPKTFYMGSEVIPAKVSLKKINQSLIIAHVVSPPPFRKLRKALRSVMASP